MKEDIISAMCCQAFGSYTGKPNMNLLHETRYNISILCMEELKPNLCCYLSVLSNLFYTYRSNSLY